MSQSLRRASIVLALSGFLLSPVADAQAPTAEYIDNLTAHAMERFDTPGIAVAVVKDGHVVYAAGYGLRDIRRPDPVDVDTIFQIASLSKAFVAVALGILVDEGKLGWDDLVIDYLPQFRMYDPWVTREFTIRDLLTHRSGLGLGAGDLLWNPDQVSTLDDIFKALRYLKPETSFRSAYAYDNLLYTAAGEIIGAVSGVPWADFIETRIMAPLKMSGCRALTSRVAGSENRATPHMLVGGELQTTFFDIDGPASTSGSINCNVSSMAKWAAMHLARGALPDGTRLLSEDTHKELWRPVTILPVDEVAREHSRTHFGAYGLGWRLNDFFGYLEVFHAGGVQGMTSFIALLPEKSVAVVVLTNSGSDAWQPIAAGVLNSYISDTPEDWLEIYGSFAEVGSANAQREVDEAFASRNAKSKPSLPLDAYVGIYRDPWYGDVIVSREKNELVMHFSRSKAMIGPLEHFQYDTFVARWRDRTLLADAYATFSLAADGIVESIVMRPVSPDTDFSFDYQDLYLKRVDDR